MNTEGPFITPVPVGAVPWQLQFAVPLDVRVVPQLLVCVKLVPEQIVEVSGLHVVSVHVDEHTPFEHVCPLGQLVTELHS